MKNKLATILTGAMLIFTTNSSPSYAFNNPKYSIINAAEKSEVTTIYTAENKELIIARKRWRRRRRRRRQVVCTTRWVYNRRYRRRVKVRICRRISRRVHYPLTRII